MFPSSYKRELGDPERLRHLLEVAKPGRSAIGLESRFLSLSSFIHSTYYRVSITKRFLKPSFCFSSLSKFHLMRTSDI